MEWGPLSVITKTDYTEPTGLIWNALYETL